MSSQIPRKATFKVYEDPPDERKKVPDPNAYPQQTDVVLEAVDSGSSAYCCCGRSLTHKGKETCSNKGTVAGYFKMRADAARQSKCGCSDGDGPCATHEYLEIVERVVFTCLAEAEFATKAQLAARHYLSMARALVHAASPPKDDAIEAFITHLQSIPKITKAQRNVALGLETVGHGGGGSLSYDAKNGFGGRPGFDEVLVKKMAVKAGQHRRHIIPWHHIRGFVNECLKSPPTASVVHEALRDIQSDAEMKAMLSRTKTSSLAAESHDWATALILMNSCRANLWPGAGSQNISINSNFFAISRAVKAWRNNPALMAEQLKEWSQASDGKANKNHIVRRAEEYLQEYQKVAVLGRANLNLPKNSKLTVDNLHTVNASGSEALFDGLQRDLDSYAHNWALTSLAFDVPVNLTAANAKVMDAVATVHRVVQESATPTAEDAKVVLDALLQPPKWVA